MSLQDFIDVFGWSINHDKSWTNLAELRRISWSAGDVQVDDWTFELLELSQHRDEVLPFGRPPKAIRLPWWLRGRQGWYWWMKHFETDELGFFFVYELYNYNVYGGLWRILLYSHGFLCWCATNSHWIVTIWLLLMNILMPVCIHMSGCIYPWVSRIVDCIWFTISRSPVLVITFPRVVQDHHKRHCYLYH